MSKSIATDRGVLGADLGATLWKLALPSDEGLRSAVFPAGDLEAIKDCVAQWKPRGITATGGGASRLGAEVAGVSVETVPEFQAWGAGAPALAALCGVELPPRYLLVSLGTGTSVLAVSPGGEVSRVGGSALGGGTLLGLGRLLLDVESFDALVALAARGDRRSVDLLVGDIYQGEETPLPRDINAASFAKLDSRRPEDLAHALMGLVGENVALICGQLVQAHDAGSVVYCGSTLSGNGPLEAILSEVTGFFGPRPRFLEGGAYCGALGAAVFGGV